MTPRAEAGAPRVDVRRVGRSDVGISCPTSANRLAGTDPGNTWGERLSTPLSGSFRTGGHGPTLSSQWALLLGRSEAAGDPPHLGAAGRLLARHLVLSPRTPVGACTGAVVPTLQRGRPRRVRRSSEATRWKRVWTPEQREVAVGIAGVSPSTRGWRHPCWSLERLARAADRRQHRGSQFRA